MPVVPDWLAGIMTLVDIVIPETRFWLNSAFIPVECIRVSDKLLKVGTIYLKVLYKQETLLT
jgi:hypothetical protein